LFSHLPKHTVPYKLLSHDYYSNCCNPNLNNKLTVCMPISHGNLWCVTTMNYCPRLWDMEVWNFKVIKRHVFCSGGSAGRIKACSSRFGSCRREGREAEKEWDKLKGTKARVDIKICIDVHVVPGLVAGGCHSSGINRKLWVLG
jgi:hypothetical protein